MAVEGMLMMAVIGVCSLVSIIMSVNIFIRKEPFSDWRHGSLLSLIWGVVLAIELGYLLVQYN